MKAMQAHDGGGGSLPVSSNITVNPGDIRQFARFLAEMTAEVSKIERQLQPYHDDLSRPRDGRLMTDFGRYAASQSASERHDRAVTTGHGAVTELRTRCDELTDAANAIARQYADLESLNAAAAASIESSLNRRDA